MIVISRRRNEGIVIGDNVFIDVVDIREDKVRLGVERPEDMPVCREETINATRQEAEN